MNDDDGGAEYAQDAAHLAVQVEMLVEEVGGQNGAEKQQLSMFTGLFKRQTLA